MTDAELEIYRAALQNERSELAADDVATGDARKPVELDQQSVGRLSRMDALQNQAMAQAMSRRRSGRALRIDAALKRIDTGDYGQCLDCGEDISKARLDLDPTLPKCLSCTQG